jgi:hypothetical protein
MRLRCLHTSRIRFHASSSPRRQSGSAVIVVMALLAIMLVYVAANIRTLSSLVRELRLLERQQTQRLQTAAPMTNSPPAITISTNSASRSTTP